jgi:hypothetical protein
MRAKCIMLLALLAPTLLAQAPPANKSDDLDVTMRVIVDPNAKVPDEIVRRIPLPKPAQPATPPSNKPAEPGAKGKERAAGARDQGREFGQQVSEEAKRRSEEARQKKPPPPGRPDNPGRPRGDPPGRPNGPPPGG